MKKFGCLLYLLALAAALLCGCGGNFGPLTEGFGDFSPEPGEVSQPQSGESSPQEFRPGEVVQLEPEAVFDFEGYDWTEHLRGEAFETGTVIGDAALDALELQVDSVTSTSVSVTVTAPDISQALCDWYAQAQEQERTYDALVAQILELLAGEKQSASFTLRYALSAQGEPVIDYTEDYAAAVSCGLLEFYTTMQNSFLETLGGNSYD